MSETTETPTKFYVTCGDCQLLVTETEPILAAMELVTRALTTPDSRQLGPLVFISQQGFRSADNLDSQTAIFTLFVVLITLGYSFRPGGPTDQLFRRSEHDQDENEE